MPQPSEARTPCSVAFPKSAQLGASAYCISEKKHSKKKKKKGKKISKKKETDDFVEVADRCLPPLPSSLLQNRANSSNRYGFYAYFSRSSISNAYVKGSLIYVYQLCGALLLGNVIILMVFLLYSKVANEAYCGKVIDFH